MVGTLSIGCILAWFMVKIYQRENIMIVEESSIQNDSWRFPLLYFSVVFVGQYLPCGAQILCLYIAVIGNWNELLQSELT